MEGGEIGLVGKEMCEECDAFLGKEHRMVCSKTGIVTDDQTTEKFTTVEKAQEEDPILGIDVPTAKLLRDHLNCKSDHPDYDQVLALKNGLDKFLEDSE